MYSILGKTTPLVPEFAVEDLASAELQPRLLCACIEGPDLGQNTHDDDDDIYRV